MDLKNPKLRWPLEVRFERTGDEEVLLMECPLGITEQPLLLVPAVAPLIASLDGSITSDELVKKFAAQGATTKLINELLNLLDRYLFLDNDHYREEEARIHEEFRTREVREPYLAGRSYSAEPETLSELLRNYLAEKRLEPPTARGSLRVLVAPHIDYMRGGRSYGATYRWLADESPDILIVIGTSHKYSEGIFHLSYKSFATPLGTLPCAKDFVRQIANGYGMERSFKDEFLHKQEHSLELQMPFLQLLKPGTSIVPILVGGFHPYVQKGSEPTADDQYAAFVESLASSVDTATQAGKNVAFICGVDMAHQGKSFGDSFDLSESVLSRTRQRDLEYLAALTAQDKTAVFAHIAEDGDERRICGFPTMYTVLDVMERLGLGCDVTTFDYDQSVNNPRGTLVSFAGMGFYNKLSTGQ